MRSKQERKDLHVNAKRVGIRSNKATVESRRPNVTQIIKDHMSGKFFQKTNVEGTSLYTEVKTTKD
tara:strand:- start:19460 stop:19657 length:198 start_codon:yes stop_codon:yes gene_type:complete